MFSYHDVLGFNVSMNYALVLHLQKRQEYSFNYFFTTRQGEDLFLFQNICQTFSLHKFHHQVNGVIGLVHSLEFGDIFMIEFPQHFYFILKTLFPISLLVCRLFLKGLDCKVGLIDQSLSEIDTGKISLSDFLYSFEELVKFLSFHHGDEDRFPLVEVGDREELEILGAEYAEHPTIVLFEYIISVVEIYGVCASHFLIAEPERIRVEDQPRRQVVHVKVALQQRH